MNRMKSDSVRVHCRGAALLAVLWIGVLGAFLLVGVQQAARIDLALAHGGLSIVQAHWLARAGLEEAIAVLQDDNPGVDSHLDLWYEDEATFDGSDPLTTGKFFVLGPADDPGKPASLPRYGVVDLSSRLNINEAEQEQLESLDVLDSAAVASILDWRDDDDQALPGGAEQPYYHQLDFPYEARNAPFETAHELKLVKSIDESIFYGEDLNLNGVLEPNEQDGSVLPPVDDSDDLLDLGLAGLVTVGSYDLNRDTYGRKRVNINTADEQTLRTRLKFSAGLARAVIDDRDFESLMELLDVEAQQESEAGRSRTIRTKRSLIQSRWSGSVRILIG